MVPDEGSTAVVLRLDDGVEVVIGHVDDERPGLDLVDRLARLQLAARRLGWVIRLRHPHDRRCRLTELLELVGLDVVLGRGLDETLADAAGLLRDAQREPEGDEEVRAEEVVERGDAAP